MINTLSLEAWKDQLQPILHLTQSFFITASYLALKGACLVEYCITYEGCERGVRLE